MESVQGGGGCGVQRTEQGGESCAECRLSLGKSGEAAGGGRQGLGLGYDAVGAGCTSVGFLGGGENGKLQVGPGLQEHFLGCWDVAKRCGAVRPQGVQLLCQCGQAVQQRFLLSEQKCPFFFGQSEPSGGGHRMQVGQRGVGTGNSVGNPPCGSLFRIGGIGRKGKRGLQDGYQRGTVAGLQRGAKRGQARSVGGGQGILPGRKQGQGGRMRPPCLRTRTQLEAERVFI